MPLFFKSSLIQLHLSAPAGCWAGEVCVLCIRSEWGLSFHKFGPDKVPPVIFIWFKYRCACIKTEGATANMLQRTAPEARPFLWLFSYWVGEWDVTTWRHRQPAWSLPKGTWKTLRPREIKLSGLIEQISPMGKHGGANILLWECCAAAGTGRLVEVKGKGEVTGMPICAQTSLMMLWSDRDSSANRTAALIN